MDELWMESGYADQFRSPSTRQQIREAYYRRWKAPEITPDTHPWQFDPLQPPQGWRYDPCYEIWIRE